MKVRVLVTLDVRPGVSVDKDVIQHNIAHAVKECWREQQFISHHDVGFDCEGYLIGVPEIEP